MNAFKFEDKVSLVDYSTFGQILGMDDNEEREFSRSIVYNYFRQARATFRKMESSLRRKDIQALSQLSHYLKGSSAALGLQKVEILCEEIQFYGSKIKNIDDSSFDKSLESIHLLLEQLKDEHAKVECYLKNFYAEKRSLNEPFI
ncbi:Phosphorelay intermediate protein [Basidiobolus ranarum]|uniref:Phosphorelay intermediate protein n=1 Tax=Basidiobolus ranarum TaxID=34480 RepID=A0ABR2X142_9FUNG